MADYIDYLKASDRVHKGKRKANTIWLNGSGLDHQARLKLNIDGPVSLTNKDVADLIGKLSDYLSGRLTRSA